MLRRIEKSPSSYRDSLRRAILHISTLQIMLMTVALIYVPIIVSRHYITAELIAPLIYSLVLDDGRRFQPCFSLRDDEIFNLCRILKIACLLEQMFPTQPPSTRVPIAPASLHLPRQCRAQLARYLIHLRKMRTSILNFVLDY